MEHQSFSKKLRPVLFLIFIDDIDIPIDSSILKFADDIKLFRRVCSDSDSDILQDDIDKLEKWCRDWLMLFNVSKCKVMHLGYNNPNHTYNLCGSVLDEVKYQKDLGVIIDNSLKPSRQCVAAAKTANRVLGTIKRSIEYKSVNMIKSLYVGLVRPHLEFAVQSWSPQLKKDIVLLEKVQRRATRLPPSLHGMAYEERLQAFKFTTFEKKAF